MLLLAAFPEDGGLRRSSSPLLATMLISCLLVSLWVSPSWAASSQGRTNLAADKILQFADHLFSKEEYYRAISEYQRFLFLAPQHPRAPHASLRIAECYYGGGKWQQALTAVEQFLLAYGEQPLRWQGYFLKARCFMELQQGEAARQELHMVIDSSTDEEISSEAWYLTALTYARESRWPEAQRALAEIGSRSPLFDRGQSLQKVLHEASQMKRKSPTGAGIMAALVPGSGHLYCERPKDGLLAFLYTGGFGLATWEAFRQGHQELGIGLGLVTLAFYAGNIFSAVNVAHKFNDRQQLRIRQRLVPFERLGLQIRGGESWLVAFSYSF